MESWSNESAALLGHNTKDFRGRGRVGDETYGDGVGIGITSFPVQPSSTCFKLCTCIQN